MGKKPKPGFDDFGTPTTPVTNRTPIEDMREPWADERLLKPLPYQTPVLEARCLV